MEEIDAESLRPTLRVDVPQKSQEKLSEEEFNRLLNKMSNPVDEQRELAVKIKASLDKKIEEDLEENGFLGDATRRWVETYNSLLEKIQKALHGDKKVNVNLNKVSHGIIGSKIRESEI